MKISFLLKLLFCVYKEECIVCPSANGLPRVSALEESDLFKSGSGQQNRSISGWIKKQPGDFIQRTQLSTHQTQ